MTKDEWTKILFGEVEDVKQFIEKIDDKISELISAKQDGLDEEARLMIIHALISYFYHYLGAALNQMSVSPELTDMSDKWAKIAADLDITHVKAAMEKEVEGVVEDPEDLITMKGGDA